MIQAPDLRDYLNLDRAQLLAVLADVCHDLCGLIHEVSLAESAELEQRIDGWQHSGETSKHGQEMAGTIRSAAAKQTLIDRRADLAIKTEEKWFILRLLDGYSDDGPSRSS